MKKIYISGQISGLDLELAKQYFQKEAELLRQNLEAEIVNPFDLFTPEEEETFNWKQFMVRDVNALFTCDAIYMLKNWKNSRGARMEHAIAIESDMVIIYEK